ncbi:MAG: ATP-binding cassette domain-containing protein [Candidatus Heimdallarchaeota archaeon]|nr:ATP-binding cassette domain-containing protein [Candidatus Heimdallarchaeota archaeon]
MNNYIDLNNMYHIYPSVSKSVVALKALSYKFLDDQIYVILGPSGSGKSTLLKILQKQLTPSAGTIEYQFTKLPENYHIGFVDQFSYRSINFENEFREIARIFSLDEKLINLFQLSTIKNNPLKSLSAGEMQRLLLALVINLNPSILILDEITAQLDPDNVNIILNILLKLKKPGRIIIIATHDKRLLDVSSEVLFLTDGYLENESLKPEDPKLKFDLQVLQGGAIKLPNSLYKFWNKPEKVNLSYELESNMAEITPLKTTRFVESKFPWDIFSSDMTNCKLKVENITISTPNNYKLEVPKNIRIDSNNIVGLFGPSGCGKTTYLELIFGILPNNFSTTGKVLIETNQQFRSHTYIRQNNMFPTHYKISRILKHIFGDALQYDKLLSVLRYFEFSLDETKNFGDYSGGQQSLIGVIIAFLLDPCIYVFDETLAYVDSERKEKFSKVIKWLSQNGRIVILTTHDKRVIKMCDVKINFIK